MKNLYSRSHTSARLTSASRSIALVLAVLLAWFSNAAIVRAQATQEVRISERIVSSQVALEETPGLEKDLLPEELRMELKTALEAELLDSDADRATTAPMHGLAQAMAASFDEQKLTAGDGAANDQFGFSVSVSGDRVVVGARLDDDKGSAYVFEYDPSGWTQAAKLTAGDGASGDQFGWSVSISGDRVVVGAPRDNDKGLHSGSAYVFEYDPSGWTQAAKLTAGDGAADDRFGFSVSISGDRVVVGAWRDGDKGFRSGSAYVFEYDSSASSWTQAAKLTDGAGAPKDRFGRSVFISGDRVVVGAPLDDDDGFNSGSVFVFEYAVSSGWSQTAKLTAGAGNAGDDMFGESVSLSGDRVVVGAPRDDDNGFNSGSAYVFEYDTVWTQAAKITASDGAREDWFGRSVSLSGDRVVVGAFFKDEKSSAYVFEYTASSWTQTAKLTASDDDQFGRSVSISGDRVVVGAPLDDDNGLNSGSAYVYSPDTDGDGIPDSSDQCPATLVPESVPTNILKPNHFALVDNDNVFDTAIKGKGNGPDRSYTTQDTGGCSCEQIIESLGLGKGHEKHGCSIGVMDTWVAQFAGAGKGGVKSIDESPHGFALEGNYPNPFNPQTTISFSTPEAVHVSLVVYDIGGREVSRLVDGVVSRGTHQATFDASNLPSGVYLYRLSTPEGTLTETMHLQK